MKLRDRSGSGCCSNYHGTEEPTTNQFRRCGGCPVAKAAIKEAKQRKADESEYDEEDE